jgi:tetratricopeptide (TPR) repeat protein
VSISLTDALPPGFEPLRRAGAEALYNLDYVTAEAKFNELIQLDPAHPAGHFYLATCRWLAILKTMRRLQIGLYTNDAFFAGSNDKVDPESDRGFRTVWAEAIKQANARLRQQKNDVSGLYYLGAAYGLLTTYEASVTRNFNAAVNNARRGVEHHETAIKLAPNLADAYLSLGLFQYFVGKLPWLTRNLLKLGGISGSRQRGLDWVRKAMEQGQYVNDDARTVLIAIYRREGRYEDALKLLEELIQKYPRNYLFRLERASVLSLLDQTCDSYAAFEQVLKDETAQVIADQIHYQYGEALLEHGEFERAVQQFTAVMQAPAADDALITLAHLGHGQAQDAAGQRAGAQAAYQNVLQRQDAFDSRKNARKYLERPYAVEKVGQAKCAG